MCRLMQAQPICRPSPALCEITTRSVTPPLHSTCTKTVLSQPQTFYHHFSNDSNRYGRYLTTDRFSVNTDVIRGLAGGAADAVADLH